MLLGTAKVGVVVSSLLIIDPSMKICPIVQKVDGISTMMKMKARITVTVPTKPDENAEIGKISENEFTSVKEKRG